MCEACHNKMHPEFLSTPSGWRATTKDKNPEAEDRVISIHALRVEGDSSAAVSLVLKSLFLSTPSGWRATVVTALFLSRAITFLSTPSGWRATSFIFAIGALLSISIHALRVEGDRALVWLYVRRVHEISIHALRVEGDRLRSIRRLRYMISIHALRVEGDADPHRGQLQKQQISIHALRVEGDKDLDAPGQHRQYFYPRPPGGGRRWCRQCSARRPQYFYPRPPGGGRQQKRTKFSSVFAQKGEEFASLRRGKRKICRWRFKKDKF